MNVEQYQRLCDALPCQLVPAQKLLTQLRASRTWRNLSAMRRAQEITDQAFREILNFIRPGMTEQQVAARLVYEMLRRGARKVSFDPIVAAGANGSMPHAVPGDRDPSRDVRYHGLWLHLGRLLLRHDPYRGGGSALRKRWRRCTIPSSRLRRRGLPLPGQG